MNLSGCKFVALLSMMLVLPGTASAADYRKLFEDADVSVVVIYTVERQVDARSGLGEVALPGLGSGVLIDDEGHVMTAAHVVQTADLVEVEFVDGTKVTASVVASDPIKDVALVKLDKLPERVRPAKLADSDKVRIGEEIFIIGAPYGLSHTLTVGHISARHKNEDDYMGEIRAETFQTDAAINQGNSGGPMFNQRGEVIGIVSHIRSKSGGSEGLGFAVTSNTAVDALLDHPMSWSGMTGVLLTGALAEALNVPQESGYLVQKVASSSPASRMGLRPSRVPASIAGQDLLIGGDIILSVGGVTISPGMNAEFREKAAMMDRGDAILLKVLRGGKVIALVSQL
ncbi:MAG: trypsin-like peptidase domain-containing protein [Gammaproteobacteria bacterium]|nr:trypsin-like peptidase domain-containing protein [Gammaproteobacteria bacterium]